MSDEEGTRIISLGERRAMKTNDCRDWTVEDMLEAALRDIKSGKIDPSMAVMFIRTTDEKGKNAKYSYFAAGGSGVELTGLVTHGLHIHLMHGEEEFD